MAAYNALDSLDSFDYGAPQMYDAQLKSLNFELDRKNSSYNTQITQPQYGNPDINGNYSNNNNRHFSFEEQHLQSQTSSPRSQMMNSMMNSMKNNQNQTLTSIDENKEENEKETYFAQSPHNHNDTDTDTTTTGGGATPQGPDAVQRPFTEKESNYFNKLILKQKEYKLLLNEKLTNENKQNEIDTLYKETISKLSTLACTIKEKYSINNTTTSSNHFSSNNYEYNMNRILEAMKLIELQCRKSTQFENMTVYMNQLGNINKISDDNIAKMKYIIEKGDELSDTIREECNTNDNNDNSSTSGDTLTFLKQISKTLDKAIKNNGNCDNDDDDCNENENKNNSHMRMSAVATRELMQERTAMLMRINALETENSNLKVLLKSNKNGTTLKTVNNIEQQANNVDDNDEVNENDNEYNDFESSRVINNNGGTVTTTIDVDNNEINNDEKEHEYTGTKYINGMQDQFYCRGCKQYMCNDNKVIFTKCECEGLCRECGYRYIYKSLTSQQPQFKIKCPICKKVNISEEDIELLDIDGGLVPQYKTVKMLFGSKHKYI